jgi:phage baseplate assembly protein W
MIIKYRGFSTIDAAKKFRLVDFDLVKQDLINHFNIKKGEKLMQPNFGSIIWNCLYEPLTPDIKAAISEDIRRIVNYDPRLQVDEVIVNEFDQGLQIQLDLTYLPGNFADSLILNFDAQSQNLTVS